MTSGDQPPPEHGAQLDDAARGAEMESADQYVRAQDFIEALRASRRPPREDGDDETLRLHEMAALLKAASPDGGEVDAGFASRLLGRLEVEQRRIATGAPLPAAEAVRDEAPQASEVAETHAARPGRFGLSRRGLLWGGLGAAAAAVAGAAVSAGLDQSSQPPSGPLVANGAGEWVAIAAVSAVPLGSVRRFEAGAVIGYLQHKTSGFLALSGICTHMACLLQWNAGERTFDCPCHGVQFLANGIAAPGAPYRYAPLPAISTKVEADHVWVYVAPGGTPSQSSEGTPSTPHGYNDATSEPGH